MKRALISTLLFFSSACCFAQAGASWERVFKNINTEVQQQSRAYETLKEATQTIGHRMTGSANGQKAEQYAYDLLKSYGYEDVKFQPFEVESWSRKKLSLTVGSSAGKMRAVKSVALAHSPVKADLEGELVDMGNGLEEDYVARPNLAKDKIVLVFLGILPGTAGRSLHRSEKTAIAIRNGAKGIIVINTVAGGVLLTGTASVTGKLISIPAICIGLEEGMKLKAQLKTGKLFTHIAMSNFSGLIKARNVVATLRGTTLPEEKIVVGGHLDSWDLATGAIDNGIGSFSVLDMARTFKKLNLSTKRTVEFVLFMGEEEGSLGSKFYVKNAIADGSINRLRMMLNYDMTGDTRSFSVTSPELVPLLSAIGKIAAGIDTSFTNTPQAGAAELHSDNQPFLLQGVPTGGAGEGGTFNGPQGCYHADCDVFSLVKSEQGLKNTVKFNSMMIYGLADADEIAAKRLSDLETRDFLLKNNLREALQLEGEWRWQ